MTKPRLSTLVLHATYADALVEGKLTWTQGARPVCSTCGRRGYWGGRWYESCNEGHPYACECGRVFATGSGIAAHRRGGNGGTPCPRKPKGTP